MLLKHFYDYEYDYDILSVRKIFLRIYCDGKHAH